jgi:3-isopropylmalate/(R)-2-methylmalate dehydratase small subunit
VKLTGKAHVYGDNINTDLIIAGKYTKTLNMADLAAHCLEDLDADFLKRMKAGDFVVGGENFGCGSSREQAPLALKSAGVQAVLARSFARIFYRNAINIGLPAIICDTAFIKMGDALEIDQQNGLILIDGQRKLVCQKLPAVMQAILQSGGLVAFLKEKGDFIL